MKYIPRGPERISRNYFFYEPNIMGCNAPLSDLLVNPLLNKSKRVFSSGGARTHTTRELVFSSQMLYQLSYRGLMLKETIFLV
jgi:hypothetical protein